MTRGSEVAVGRGWRRFVVGVLPLVMVAAAAVAGAASGQAEEAVLTHGPVVGAVTDTSAVVFARVSAPSAVRVVYSTDPGFGGELGVSPRRAALARHDHTVRIPLVGLQAATTYYYRVVVGGVVQQPSIPPRFTTAPPPDALVDFNFAVFSDLSVDRSADAPAYRDAAGHNPAFVLQIGDFDHRNPGSPQRESITIWNWRFMHRDVLQDMVAGGDFAANITPFFPLYHMWDDHDYGANDTDGRAWWKPLATKAFWEYYPLPALPNVGGGLWYSFRYAQAEVWMLDLRSQRDPDDEPDGPGKSMLDGGGIENGQKEWLKAGLLASTARWKFIVSTSVWNRNSKRRDSWYLYQDEQDELVQFIRDNGIEGVIILSGDLHSGGAIDDGSDSFFPELSVPTTNGDRWSDCTGGYCGMWSEGILTGIDPSGYGLVSVLHDEASGKDSVVLQARGEDGSFRLEYVVTLP